MPHLTYCRSLVLSLLVSTLLVSCRPAAERPTAKDVILITVDTLRADALGFAGNTRVQTPLLDRLAATGRVFDQAHAHSTVTLPSHANILTGLYPYRHGVRDNLGFILGGEQVTVAESLREADFVTGAFVAAIPLAAATGLDQGFDTYDDRLPAGDPGNPFKMEQRSGAEVVAAAHSWWNQHEDQRRFLWVHLFEPHAPYQPPEPFVDEYARKPYLGEVAATDAYLAPLLEPLLTAGEAADTLVVFTSDHGESLGEHGEATHGFFAYESTLRVPLVLWGPGVTPGRDSRPARHVDLFATILEAVGIDDVPETDGRSLIGQPEDVGASPASYFESLTANLTRGWAPLHGVIQDGEKAIDLPVPELYDLVDDPAEERNLASEQPGRLRTLLDSLPDVATAAAERQPVSFEIEQRLQALGYLGGAAPGKGSYGVEDDLKNLVHLDRGLMRVHMLFTRGEYARAAELAVSLLAERQDLAIAQEYLAFSLLHLGRVEEAVAVMRQAHESGNRQRSLLRQLAVTLTRTGRGAEAVTLLQEMLGERGGGDLATRNALALSLIGAGRVDEAIGVAESILEEDPDNVVAYENLALASQALEEWTEARDYGIRATEIDPERADAWSNLGVAHSNLGDPTAAMAAWERALELDPSHVDALFNLGVTAAESAQVERARSVFGRFLEVAPSRGYEREIEVARRVLSEMPG